MMKSIFKTFFLSLCIIANTHFAYSQTASILPQGKTQFLDNNAKPLTSGTVDFYIPSTSTRKTTWQNSGETIANTNPVVLDAGGRAIIYGDGSYRMVVKDRLGNLIYDQVTSSTGSGSSASTATGDGDLVGTIKPWAGMTAPNQYMFTYGQEVSRTTYSALYTAITSTQAAFCNSGSPVLNGLSDTTNFWIGMSVEITCVAAGFSTVVSKTASTVTLAANANVTVNANAIFYPWGRGNGTTTFNLPDFRGLIPTGNNNMGGVASANLTTTYFGATNPNSAGALGGTQFNTLLAVNIPGHSHPVFLNDPGHGHPGSLGSTQGNGVFNITTAAQTGGNNTGVTTAQALTIASATTGITIRDTSGGFGTSNQTNTVGGGIAVSATLGNTGSGYTNGSQTITITGGTCTTQPQFTVTVAGNVFTGTPALLTAGSCTVAPANPAATSGGGGTGGTLNVIYSAQPFSLIPPSKTTNFIIKVTPDTNSATASGVTSLGTMTGDIACGSGLTCTGNIISETTPITVSAPVIPVIHPSSGNLVGTGCSNFHQIWWVDQNFCSLADSWVWTSQDPSGLFQATVGGTITNGDTVSLTFDFAGVCAGGPAGCKVTYNITGADTTTTIAKGLACAIANNANLFNLNGGSCAGGAVTPPVAGYGGYATGKQIGYVVATSPVVALDFDSRVSMKVTATITGAATESVTIANTNCGVVCSNAWDNNPAWQVGKVVCTTYAGNGTSCATGGVAPPVNSQLFAMYSNSSNSASPTSVNTTYGIFTNQVLNSTSGALQSRWSLITPDITGTMNQGVHVGNGVYTVGVADKGIDSINTKQLWVSGTEELILSGTTFEIVSGAGHDISLIPALGNAGVTQTGVDVDWRITGDVAKNQVLSWRDSTIRWQAYKPSSSTDLRFFDNTADRVIFKNGGVVQVTTGGLTVGDTGSPASGVISAATGYRIANAAPTAAHVLRSNGINFIDAQLAAADLSNGTTGTGAVALADSPVFTTQITDPLVIGGTGAASTLTLESTSGAGTTDAIIFKTASQTTRGRFTTGGSFIIGTTTTGYSGALLDVNYNSSTPAAPQGGLSHIRITAADGGFPAFTGESFGAGNSFFTMRAASGTLASPSATTAGHAVGAIAFSAWDGSQFQQIASIQVNTLNQTSGTDRSSFIDFNSTASGSTSPSVGLRLQGSGGISVGTVTDLGAGTILANGAIKTLSSTASSSATTGSIIAGGGIGASGDIYASGNHAVTVAAKTLLLKQGANGAVGTFVCNGATPVTVNNTNVAISDGIGISLNTVGGTVGAIPAIKTITAATGFTVACTAADTSTMNYWIIKNAA